MAKIEFEGVKENPFSPKNRRRTTALIDGYMDGGRKVKEILRPDQAEARVRINPPGGVARILVVSDLHFGAEAADLKIIKALMEPSLRSFRKKSFGK